MKLTLVMRTLFTLILIAGSSLLQAQIPDDGSKKSRDCSDEVNSAEVYFNGGYYDRCIAILEEVLKTCRLSRSDKLLAMETLAKAYIETGDPLKAESVVNLMWKNFPHYELREHDNFESFNRMVNKFKVHPVFSVGNRFTLNWQKFVPLKIYSVLSGLDYSAPYEKPEYGTFQGFDFRYYGWAELEFNGGVSLNGDMTFKWAEFSRNFEKDPGFRLSLTETDNYIEVPLYVKKYFHYKENLFPYITAGMGWLYMNRAVSDATISYTSEDIITGKNQDFNAVENNIDMTGMRNRNTFEWIAGAGIGYKLKNLRIFLDLRYFGGLKSFTDPEKGLNNTMLVNDFFYVDNSVKLNQFEAGISLSYTIINAVRKIGK